MTFAQKLRELRDAQGLSEAKLAERAGVSFAALHDYGLGRRMPSLPAAVKIARALGVPCDVFADCEDVAGEGARAEEAPPVKRERPRKQPGGQPKQLPPSKGKGKGK